MADEPTTPTPAPVPDPVTRDVALQHAARLLLAAEMLTDQALMARYESLADSWIAVAHLLGQGSE